MRKLFQPSVLLSTAALVVALGGTATAASLITGSQIKKNTITGANVKNGSLTGSDIKNASITPAKISGVVGRTGPAGPAGPQGAPGPGGPQGPAGAAGAAGSTVAAALINGNGTIASRSGNISASRIAAGTYCINAPGGKIAVATLSVTGGAEEIYVAHGGLEGCPAGTNFGVQTRDNDDLQNRPDTDSNFSILIED